MIKKLIPHTIRGRIMAATALVTSAIAILTVTVCFSVFQSFLRKNQIQSCEFSLQMVCNNIDADMKPILEFSRWCYSSTDVLDYLSTFQDQDPLYVAAREDAELRTLALNTYNRVKEEYFNTNARKNLNRVLITTTNRNNFIQVMENTNNSYASAARAVAESQFFAPLLEADDFRWLGFVDDPFSNVSPEQVIPIVRPIYNEFNSQELGWLYAEISSKLFTSYLRSYPLPRDSSIYITLDEKTYRIDQNSFLEVPAEQIAGQTVHENAALDPQTRVMSIQMEGRSRTLIQRPIDSVEGWYLSQILSEQQFSQQRKLYTMLIGIIFIAIASLGALLTVLLNRSIGQPIQQLCQKIDAISEGDFRRSPEIEWEHELGTIGQGINNMQDKILNLMDKRVADEKQRKDLEYQILQSQINPHFLYNTLNSIKWMATIQNASGIADMITALARLLKSVSKGTSSMVTVEAELSLLKDYFLIQKYRYGGSVTLDCQVESEELYQCEIHRFTLQPIVENALFHGIEPKGTAGRILVDIRVVEHKGKKALQLSITDNGVGMDCETINRVLNEDLAGKNKTDFFRQVGISNVNQRIKHDFGPDYGITIESQVGVSTTMTILRPFVLHRPEGDAEIETGIKKGEENDDKATDCGR